MVSLSPEEWATALEEHQECIAEWDIRERLNPGIAQTYHGVDHHLPRHWKLTEEAPDAGVEG